MPGEKRTALVIDDDELIRQFLHDLLTTEGYSATCCGSGPTALELSRGEQFEIIITDYHMDGINGADIAKELRIRCPDSLIIGISGEQKKKAFLEAGADAFCQKPFTSREFVAMIRNLA